MGRLRMFRIGFRRRRRRWVRWSSTNCEMVCSSRPPLAMIRISGKPASSNSARAARASWARSPLSRRMAFTVEPRERACSATRIPLRTPSKVS